MAVQPRLIQQHNVAEIIKEIVELAKNPQALIYLHDSLREQHALTEKEKQKANDARALITQYDKLLGDLKQKEEQINIAKTTHETNLSFFESKCLTQESYFKEREDKLSTKEAAHTEAKKLHEKEVSGLIEQRAELAAQQELHDKIFCEYKAKLKKQESELLDRRSLVAEKEHALKEREAQLKAFLG